MSQEQPYQYNTDDIRRYFEGKLSKAEMHAMESAALDDPFLADAMEGYQAGLHSSADTADLQARLSERTNSGKVVPMRRNRWYLAAAVTVGLIGSVYALFYLASNPEPVAPVVATVEDSRAAEAKEAPAADSITVRSNQPSRIREASTPTADTQDQPALPSPDTAKEVMALNEVATEERASPATAPDRLSRAKAEDENVKRLRSVAPPAAPLAAKAKKDEPGSRIYTEPADGWSAFEVYVLNNLRRPKEPVLHGNVVLIFQVNPDNGKIFDVKVDKSLHPLYDKEAIRLLKEGPDWVVYNTDAAVKTTYTVVF